MNLISIPGWIVDEWFSNPKIHGILQNVIQVLTFHPRHPLIEGHKHVMEEKSMQLQAK
jgi:hypothetical protein